MVTRAPLAASCRLQPPVQRLAGRVGARRGRQRPPSNQPCKSSIPRARARRPGCHGRPQTHLQSVLAGLAGAEVTWWRPSGGWSRGSAVRAAPSCCSRLKVSLAASTAQWDARRAVAGVRGALPLP